MTVMMLRIRTLHNTSINRFYVLQVLHRKIGINIMIILVIIVVYQGSHDRRGQRMPAIFIRTYNKYSQPIK